MEEEKRKAEETKREEKESIRAEEGDSELDKSGNTSTVTYSSPEN